MFKSIDWIFFDVGSTLVDEHIAYEHRIKDIADSARVSYEFALDTAVDFYRQNKRGDLETARLLGVELPKWHEEDEFLYSDTVKCLEFLGIKYKLGVIANQSFGTKGRLRQYGILKYIDLIVASAEEGIAKPDRRIFEIALKRANCLPKNSVMIGDRIDNDIVPANLLGMKTIWIKNGFGKYWDIKTDDERPDCTVESLTELLDIF